MEVVVNNFWCDKRVLITGHTGFKGAWLALWLHSLGARILGVSLDAPSEPCLHDLARLKEIVDSRRGDIRNGGFLTSFVQEFHPEIVFHLAAQALVRPSYQHPVETFATNVMGTVNLLEACRLTPSVRAVIVVTSDKCYENREQIWGYREIDPMGGHDPYSASKGCAELVAASWRRSFGMNGVTGAAVATVRAGNVIGGGDFAKDRLVPDLVRAFSCDEPVTLRYPSAVRPWQFVLEPLRGYVMLAQRLYGDGAPFAQAWNFGPADDGTRSVREVAESVAHLWGDGKVCVAGAEKSHEAGLLTLNSAQARSMLGWRPTYCFETALQETIRWYQLWNENQHDIRQVCLDQIRQYVAATECLNAGRSWEHRYQDGHKNA